MSAELVGKGLLHTNGGPGPNVNFPRDEREWNPPEHGYLDGYHALSNGVSKGTVSRFTLGVTVYLSQIEAQGDESTIWPGSHKDMGRTFPLPRCRLLARWHRACRPWPELRIYGEAGRRMPVA